MSHARRQLPLNALRVFESVARYGSVTAGADALSITQSAASRHISRLEDIVGHSLFVREGRGVSLTPAGRLLLPSLTRAFDGISQALRRLGADRTLRLHIPPSFLQRFSLPLIQGFRDAHPQFSLTIISTNGTGPPREEADVSILFDDVNSQNGVRLWEIDAVPVCSVSTLRGLAESSFDKILSPENLLHVRIEGLEAGFLWSRFAESLGLEANIKGGLVFETSALAVDYARTAGGIALADPRMVAAELDSGLVVKPFDAVAKTGYAYFLALSRSSQPDPGALLLRDWILSELSPLMDDARSGR